jgi:secondary thiamine-phosphate synthase enzyme
MAVVTGHIPVKSRGETDIIDLTDNVKKAVKQSGLTSGIATIFVPGATGALTTIEYEPGLLHDLPAALERIVPRSISYEHEKRWHDGNGHSHVRASLLGPSLTVPFHDGQLILGTWQQIIFIELDTHARTRDLVVQILGE